MSSNFAIQPFPHCASRVALVNRLSSLRGDPRAARTKLYEASDCCFSSSGSETISQFMSKKFAAVLDKNFAEAAAQRHPQSQDENKDWEYTTKSKKEKPKGKSKAKSKGKSEENAKEKSKDKSEGKSKKNSKDETINFNHVKSLLAIALVCHDLKASKSNPLVFTNSLARTAEEKRQTPGYHTIEFVGRLASSGLYRTYIEKITSCVGYASYMRDENEVYGHCEVRKEGVIYEDWFIPIPQAFETVDFVMRHINVLSAKRGGINYKRVRELVEYCKSAIHEDQKWIPGLIRLAVDKHMGGFRYEKNSFLHGTKAQKMLVRKSLPAPA